MECGVGDWRQRRRYDRIGGIAIALKDLEMAYREKSCMIPQYVAVCYEPELERINRKNSRRKEAVIWYTKESSKGIKKLSKLSSAL